MNKLALLAAIFVMSTGLALGQTTSPATTDPGRPTAGPDQSQTNTPSANPMSRTRHDNDTTLNPDRAGSTQESAMPNTTIDDQQPGNSTTGSPSSTMGTTGSTPGTEPSAEGNKSGTSPANGETPDDSSAKKPHTSEDTYSSGSKNPNSSANGASSNDMSGTTPKPDNSTNSTTPQTAPPHIATHTPDAGTEMNPASLAIAVVPRN